MAFGWILIVFGSLSVLYTIIGLVFAKSNTRKATIAVINFTIYGFLIWLGIRLILSG